MCAGRKGALLCSSEPESMVESNRESTTNRSIHAGGMVAGHLTIILNNRKQSMLMRKTAVLNDGFYLMFTCISAPKDTNKS